jgi:aspartyl-tRNA(Asn)/glutamyl-tRNA(Gln) amidotransferase subunit C
VNQIHQPEKQMKKYSRKPVNKPLLRKMADLARLEIDDASEDQLLEDLNNIITWAQQLDELDTEGVEPLIHMSQEINVFREDRVGDQLTNEQALRNAPARKDEFFKVPQSVVKKINS